MLGKEDNTSKLSSHDSSHGRILNMLNPKTGKGMCSPLANLYASYKMGSKEGRKFLDGDEQTTAECVEKMADHQEVVYQEINKIKGTQFASLVQMNIAFYDNQRMFRSEFKSVDEVTDPEQIANSFGNDEHVLINFPTDPAPHDVPEQVTPYHMVYFGKDKLLNRCSYFNSNLPRPEHTGSCHKIIEFMANDIRAAVSNDGKKCLVTRSI